uniref:uncharacterized protein LOC113474277 n=1 Tax=Ciona intestinalis TaxID=7719 RepID=UPI000EF51EA1|nr:uncharacterized protein LOC113474277 [Ciona intestinalis]|eukprot:XP_026690505.1 uncharacterized protein LOC113474277 [Ciona intestinalis]
MEYLFFYMFTVAAVTPPSLGATAAATGATAATMVIGLKALIAMCKKIGKKLLPKLKKTPPGIYVTTKLGPVLILLGVIDENDEEAPPARNSTRRNAITPTNTRSSLHLEGWSISSISHHILCMPSIFKGFAHTVMWSKMVTVSTLFWSYF